jgi:Pyridoxamine 5'-phosphate oxidase
LADLESILKQSLMRASSHSKKIYGKNPLTAQEVFELANSKGTLGLAATLRPNGQPHLSPVDDVALDGKLYLGVDKATARYKNLQRNPRLTLMIMDGWKRQAIIEGKVRFLEMGSTVAKRVGDAQKKKYGWTTDSLTELMPERAFTYKST